MLDDLLEPEVMIAVGVTAAVMSPPVRKVLRKGVVYGLAGLLIAGDKIVGAARGMAQGAQNLTASARTTTQEAAGTAERAAAPVAG
jgi:hypothetical protein